MTSYPFGPNREIPGVYVIIPAGGAGIRLWPMSREGHPKFLLDVTLQGRSLIQATWDRLLPLTSAGRLAVVAGPGHVKSISDQLPDLVQDNFCEPGFKDFMAAIGGPIPSDDRDKVYFMDLYIPSYTPTLFDLIESRKPGSPPKTVDKPSLLLAAQPETLPGARGEIDGLEAVGSPVTTLVSEKATPTTVILSLRDHQFVHFVCHGLLEPGKPFDASFDLHGGPLTLLEIARSQLPSAEFAFLSACHTAELTEASVADGGLHLAAAMRFYGFRSVIGTMWDGRYRRGRPIKAFLQIYFLGQPKPERSAISPEVS